MDQVEGGVGRSALKTEGMPEHVAIIMDGNGRWARGRGLPRFMGHREGARRVREIVEEAASVGLGYLTLYAFSEENWNRPTKEVRFLMRLLEHQLITNLKLFERHRIRLNVIGDRSRLPQRTLEVLTKTIERLDGNQGMTLTLALSYGARTEIQRMCKRLAKRVATGEISPDQIDQRLMSEHLDTYDMPDPDLLIRTSGECRVSNFMLWQLAYTEFYFTDTYWPDFTSSHLQQAFAGFQSRERRYGRVVEVGEKIRKDLRNDWWSSGWSSRGIANLGDGQCLE